MSRRKSRGRGVDARTGRSKGSGRFLRLDAGLTDSAAWLSLSPAERAVYIDLACHYDGRNNGAIAYSIRMAVERCNLAPNTASRALHTLEERGLIDRMTASRFKPGTRHATLWRVTAFKCDATGSLASRRFNSWRPPANGCDAPFGRK